MKPSKTIKKINYLKDKIDNAAQPFFWVNKMQKLIDIHIKEWISENFSIDIDTSNSNEVNLAIAILSIISQHNKEQMKSEE